HRHRCRGAVALRAGLATGHRASPGGGSVAVGVGAGVKVMVGVRVGMSGFEVWVGALGSGV
ncbi:MAG: hypothetical protein P8Y37_10995, partial [Anaerolineales bacterium]